MRSLSLLIPGLAVVSVACTVYTSCPEDDDDPGAAGSSMVGGNGSSAEGGSTSRGGAVGAGDAGAANGATSNGGGGLGQGGGTQTEGEWVNVTSNLANRQTACGNTSVLSAKPDEDLIIVGLAEAGLWGTRDGGETWQELAQGDDSVPVANVPSGIVYDPEDADTFWESGIYGVSGIYRTQDGGDTFEQLGAVHHNDFVSIDFSDPDRQTLLATGHEQGHTLHRSQDGGQTWESIGANIPPNAKTCMFPHVVSHDTYLLGCGGGVVHMEGDAGIYRSTDAGQSWSRVSTHGGASPPLITSDGTLYWAAERGSGLAMSTDAGESWSLVVGDGVVSSVGPVELPDGRIATVGAAEGPLGAQITRLVVSDDGGETWAPVSPNVPFQPLGLVYSAYQRAFFIWYANCDTKVQPDAIQRYDFDYEAR